MLRCYDSSRCAAHCATRCLPKTAFLTAAHTCSRQCNFEIRHACETYLPKIAFWSGVQRGRRRLRSWARLQVRLSRFACTMRLISPAIVRKTRGRDCGQRLSRKGARPYQRRCHTRFTRESKRRLQTTHVWATRKYRRARSSPSATLWAAPSDINDALLAAGAAEER